MEGKKEKIFPWMKDVLQSFATSFMVDYDSNVLCILHRLVSHFHLSNSDSISY